MADTALVEQTNKGEMATTESTRSRVTFTPRFDVVENEEAVVLYGDLPGVHGGDLEVSFERGELKIHGRCQARHPEQGWLAKEYELGDFYRSFAIQEAIDANQISAELRDGVLMITLPKSENAKPKRISVKSS